MMLFIISCAGQSKTEKPVAPFSERFYSVKDLNTRDIDKLESINRDAPPQQSRAAALILGHYYVQNGEVEKGRIMLSQNYDENILSSYMKHQGLIWLYDAEKTAGNMERAEEYAERIFAKSQDPLNRRLAGSYCASEKITVKDNNPFTSCFSGRFRTPKEQFEMDEPKPFVEIEPIEPIEDNETVMDMDNETMLHEFVHVVNPENTKLMQGMIQALDTRQLPYKVTMETVNEPDAVKVDTVAYALQLSGDIYRFGYSREKIAMEAAGYVMMREQKAVILAYSNAYEEPAQRHAEEFKSLNTTVYTVNFEKGSLEHEMKAIQKKHEEERLDILVLSEERKLVDVVPLIRYLVDEPKLVKIIIGTDAFTKKYLEKDFLDYFRYTVVITSTMLVGKPEASEFRKNYMANYGEEPPVDSYLGYDILSFLAYKEGRIEQNYLTGITAMENGNAVRNVGVYEIISDVKIIHHGG